MLNALGMVNNRLLFDARTFRVLVADDDEEDRMINTMAMSNNLEKGDNIDFTEAESLEEAIDAIKTSNFNLVVTDGHLTPIKEKNEGLKIIRAAREKEPPIPTIMASDDDSLQEEAEKLGAKFIKKEDALDYLGKAAAELLYQKDN